MAVEFDYHFLLLRYFFSSFSLKKFSSDKFQQKSLRLEKSPSIPEVSSISSNFFLSAIKSIWGG